MPDGNPEVRRGRKFDQVLDGAREVFMAEGYEGASVDDIAKAAGVSKATLYSYFPDKKILFMEVARQECERQAEMAGCASPDVIPPRQYLTEFAEAMLTMLLSPFGLAIFRICVAESERFPQLGREFHESGPMVIRGEMINYFEAAMERGDLKIDDFDLAADQFFEMCKASLHLKMMLGIIDEVPEAERRRVIDGAVETFMARYGAPA